jgi:hypothetical protein
MAEEYPDTTIVKCEDDDSLVHGVLHVFKDDQSLDTLTLEVRIVCARCGMSVVTFPGHHLDALATIIDKARELHPMKVGGLAELPHPKGTA